MKKKIRNLYLSVFIVFFNLLYSSPMLDFIKKNQYGRLFKTNNSLTYLVILFIIILVVLILVIIQAYKDKHKK